MYTFLLGILGGVLFSLFSLPLPWILGPMTLTIIFSMTFKEAYLPSIYRKIGFCILGIAMGLYFSPNIGRFILNNIEVILVFSIVTILIGIANGMFIKCIFKLDIITAILSNIPGGLSQMVEIGRELGGEVDVIAIKQTLRIVFVVVVVPTILVFFYDSSASYSVEDQKTLYTLGGLTLLLLLGGIGVYIAMLIRAPVPFITGPLLIISVLSLLGMKLQSVPPIILHIGQLFIGISIGSQFKKEQLLNYRKYLIIGLLATMILTFLSAIMAYFLTLFSTIDYPTAILSLAPGGLAEMSITAALLGANVPIVAAFQVLRMILAVIVFPSVMNIFIKKTKEKTNLS